MRRGSCPPALILAHSTFAVPFSTWMLTGFLAGGVITALPIVFFFMLVQRQLIAGLTAGAVKG